MLNPIFDDYVLRKNIDTKECFIPKHKMCFFVNCNVTYKWKLVEIIWKNIVGHPSHFLISLKSLKSNSFKESFGQNFYLEYSKNAFWDEVEEELKFLLINNFDLNFNHLISEKFQAKIVSWIFFVNSIDLKNNKVDPELKKFAALQDIDNFFTYKEFEYEVDKILLYLKRKHKIFHNYYEIYFEQEFLDFYWYDSYYFLSGLFFQTKLKSKVYLT